MRTWLIIAFLLLQMNFVWAQTTRSMSGTVRLGVTPYEMAQSIGLGLQFTEPLGKRTAISGSVGMMNGEYVTQMANYTFANTELTTTADLSALLQLTPHASKYKMSLGAGASLLYTVFHYGAVTQPTFVTMERSKAATPMLHLLIGQHYALNQHWGLFARGIYRSSLAEREVVDRNISTGGEVGTRGGIRHNYSLELGVSYFFTQKKTPARE